MGNMKRVAAAERIIRSRRELLNGSQLVTASRSLEAAEGGCGVLGFAANAPVAGKHVLTASAQMHNRGNGKGGGIAMAGLDPAQVGVDADTLRSHYLLQLALLDAHVREEVERRFIHPFFDVAHACPLAHVDDVRQVPCLEVRPPDVWRYFVRVKPAVLEQFTDEKGLSELPARVVEDEFVYQNSYRLNQTYYASLGEKRAFVLSHGRNLSVLKIVGYAEQVVSYYQLEEQTAHVWIAHQRYPTKGRVWHPGGAHPFIGLNEALVHNGDFANYHAVCEYLRQRNIGQLFLTDTEVSVQLFDLWDRVYGYPLEITLEAMAPTTEHDALMLPSEKRELYLMVQRAHIHGSPDGPWFFILARSFPDQDRYELLGITDTSMLRPQVFALYEYEAPPHQEAENGGERLQIGLIASERQAINACLRSLAEQDERYQPLADQYWVARGGSHTDGGAFLFSVHAPMQGSASLTCADKFGRPVLLTKGRQHVLRSRLDAGKAGVSFRSQWQSASLRAFDNGGALSLWEWLYPQMAAMEWDELAWGMDWWCNFAREGVDEWEFVRNSLNLLRDRCYPTGVKKQASLLSLVDDSLRRLFGLASALGNDEIPSALSGIRRLTWEGRFALQPPAPGETVLVIDTFGFPPEGEQCAARWMERAYHLGWRHLIAYNWRGGRFAACGLGANSHGVQIELYGDVGDYAASGLDGAEVYIHGDGQDQYGQIMKRGKLVIFGDVGQTFLYGAKGGEIYVRGSAAGRPLINAVGSPRAVINGTCLDYLAESFMAGDPLRGGGFVILNGVKFDADGRLQELATPYPGGNLFSLASGGAIYLRDPFGKVDEDQLNGGVFQSLTPDDWALILPYLQENERLFGITIEDLLRVDGSVRAPDQVYRKVVVRGFGVLSDTETALEAENR